jgi:hypothetical protein
MNKLSQQPGHETAATYRQPVIKELDIPSIVCPEMNGCATTLHHPTMTPEQCLTRINEGNMCAKGCKVARRLIKAIQ